MAYIEPIDPASLKKSNRSRSRSPAHSPQRQQQNRLPTGQSVHHHHHRRHHTIDNTSKPSRIHSKNPPTTTDDDEETKQYLKILVEEMQAMKMEMSKLRQTPVGPSKGRSDSLQIDLKEIRSNIDLIRSRIAMTPRIMENKK
jgi:hypothetical protein